jgi:hypothetical protein
VRRDFLKAARSWPELEEWMWAWVDDIRALYRLKAARLEVWDSMVPLPQQPAAFVEESREMLGVMPLPGSLPPQGPCLDTSA